MIKIRKYGERRKENEIDKKENEEIRTTERGERWGKGAGESLDSVNQKVREKTVYPWSWIFFSSKLPPPPLFQVLKKCTGGSLGYRKSLVNFRLQLSSRFFSKFKNPKAYPLKMGYQYVRINQYAKSKHFFFAIFEK